MDFQTLNRRQLQTLCKLNKIPANITNIAMADALKSLETVEGIEEFLNPSRTETVGLSIGSPERIEVTSPRKKAKKMDVNKVLETPLVSCTRKNDPETVQTARRSTRLALKRSGRLSVSVSVTSKEYLGKHNDVVLDETHESEIHESSKIDKVVHVDTTTTTLEKVDSSGDVDNLNMKFDKIFGEFGDLDLNERRNDGEKFNNSDDKSGQLDNLKPVLECICNPSESSKSDNHNVDEVMNAKDIEENLSGNTVDFVYLKKQKVSMSFESRAKEPQESVIEVEAIEELLNLSRSETGGMSIESPERIEATSPIKKAKIDVNKVLKSPMVSKKALTPSSSSPSQLTECEDIASLVSKSTPQQDTVSSNKNSQVIERETSEEAVNINLFLNEEKHDVIVLDESLWIEKVDKSSEVETSVQLEAIMDIQEPQQTLMPTIHHLNSQQLNQEGDFNEEEGQISIREVSEVSVVEIEKNNNEKEEDVKDEKGNSLVKSSSSSLRQLKKRLKETLSKSPTPVKIKIKNEEKIDEKEGGGDDKKAKSLNDARSMRQLKKQLKKALSGQCNKDTKS